jgi:hypothetical protein
MRLLVCVAIVILCCGCATYRFGRGQPPYDKGYVVSRQGQIIPEYTLGENDSVPELAVAKERFKRRREVVEGYYKKMGIIANLFKENFADRAVAIGKIVGGVFMTPATLISDYRYERDPEYRRKVRQLEDEQEAQLEVKIRKLKEELYIYIQQDLARAEAAK